MMPINPDIFHFTRKIAYDGVQAKILFHSGAEKPILTCDLSIWINRNDTRYRKKLSRKTACVISSSVIFPLITELLLSIDVTSASLAQSIDGISVKTGLAIEHL
jgi:hypothetical protein